MTRYLLSRFHNDRRFRFLVIGGYNTAFGYFAFAFAYLLLGARIHYLILAVVMHFIAVTNSFLTQRFLVFRSKSPWPGEYLRFQLTYLTTLPIGTGLLALFHHLAGMPILVAQACSLAILVVYTYIASSRFAFRTPSNDVSARPKGPPHEDPPRHTETP